MNSFNFTEMFKLRDLLKEANIPFRMREIHDGLQIIYPDVEIEDAECDAALHGFSYGHELGLLEIMGLLTDDEEENDSVLGNLTAEEVYNRIKAHFDSLSFSPESK